MARKIEIIKNIYLEASSEEKQAPIEKSKEKKVGYNARLS